MEIKIAFIVIKAPPEDITQHAAAGPANPPLKSTFAPNGPSCHIPGLRAEGQMPVVEQGRDQAQGGHLLLPNLPVG